MGPFPIGRTAPMKSKTPARGGCWLCFLERMTRYLVGGVEVVPVVLSTAFFAGFLVFVWRAPAAFAENVAFKIVSGPLAFFLAWPRI